jgi:TonB family protein
VRIAASAAARIGPAAASSRRGLLREVKATYSEEARRANIVGDVVMEVVVRADGTVGSARVTRGLGFGLDERAAAAVRSGALRRAPRRRPGGRRVEVAMEFNLR